MSTGNEGQNETGNDELLLDQVRRVMRVRRYSIHSERSYVDWIRRYVKFHRMKSRADLQGGEAKIEAFLTDIDEGGVSPNIVTECVRRGSAVVQAADDCDG